MRRVAVLLSACLLLVGFAWSGQDYALSQRIVAPGGVSALMPSARIEQALLRLPHREGHVITSAQVEVHWRAFDPGAYQLDYTYRGDSIDGESMDFSLNFQPPESASAPPHATVLLLHGWMMDGGSLLPWALHLAEAGYRTITMDLRNHGGSSAALAGYGTREAFDVVDLVSELRERGEIVGPLHILGVSYGAATAIFSARELGLDVGSVVAIESFDNAAGAVRDMVPHLLSKAPDTPLKQIAHHLTRWRMSADTLERAITMAGERLNLPLDTVDVGAALSEVRACVLLIHGSEDRHVPVTHGRSLARAAPRAQYIEVAGENHISLPMRLDRLAPTVIDWFGKTQTPAGCAEPLALKPYPARRALLAEEPSSS